MRIRFFSLIMCSAVIFSLCISYKTVLAVSGSEWRAGRIIDDGVFTDVNSMSASMIQQFLNSKVPVCDTTGSQPITTGSTQTRAQWAQANGKQAPPYTCLKDYYEVPKTVPGPGVPANNYGGKPIPTGAKSAAQMIWDAAQQYRISPKVLLTTIQKESAGPLIVDDWPFLSQYTYAMGADCPDGPTGANCDPNYAGFSIQISESARLFRYYLDNINQPWWPYAKVGHNDILYNVSARQSVCGTKSVFIENSATAALYTYTPYTPNQAALDNMYSAVPGNPNDPSDWNAYCAAYGNRNFWRIYKDWFGNTYANCTYPTNNQGETYRLLQPNTNTTFLTSDPYEVCYATGHLGYVFDTTLFYPVSGADTGVYRLEKNGIYFYTISTQERDNAVNKYGYHLEGVAFAASPVEIGAATKPIYRLSYTPTGGYMYTPSSTERDQLVQKHGFKYEGIAFYVNNDSGTTLYDVFRLSHPSAGYLFTASSLERDSATQLYSFQSEGIGFRTRIGYSVDSLPVYRLNSGHGYLLTTDFGERKYAMKMGYRPEGIDFFAYPTTNFGASVVVYRLSHINGNYLYTVSSSERDTAVNKYGYHYEGIVFRTP